MIDRQTRLYLYFIAALVFVTGGGLAGFQAVRTIIVVPKLVAKTILSAFVEQLGMSPIVIDVVLLLGIVGIFVLIGVVAWTRLSDWLQSI